MDEAAIRNPQSEIDAEAYEAERRLYRAVKVVAETAEGKIMLEWLYNLVDHGGTAFCGEETNRTNFNLGRQDPVNRIDYILRTPMDVLLAKVDVAERQHKDRTFSLLGGPPSEFNLFRK